MNTDQKKHVPTRWFDKTPLTFHPSDALTRGVNPEPTACHPTPNVNLASRGLVGQIRLCIQAGHCSESKPEGNYNQKPRWCGAIDTHLQSRTAPCFGDGSLGLGLGVLGECSGFS